MLAREGLVTNHRKLLRLFREGNLRVRRWRGRRIRVPVVDDFTRENLALEPDTSISGAHVARELDAMIAVRGKPPMMTPPDCQADCASALMGTIPVPHFNHEFGGDMTGGQGSTSTS